MGSNMALCFGGSPMLVSCSRGYLGLSSHVPLMCECFLQH